MSEKQSLVKENKEVEYDNVIYFINEEDSTAGVRDCQQDVMEYNIPRSIKEGSKEYDITSILGHSFRFSRIKMITFASDSKLQTIKHSAFFNASIESITIPSELINLEDGWCYCTQKLTKIAVNQQNPRYCCYEGKMILGKTNLDQKNYDCLVFCVRDIQRVVIPNFIEHICSYCFHFCGQLEQIEFENDSKLKTIGKYAFSNSIIESITIPSSVTIIGERAFFYCKQLKNIEFASNSNLQTIERHAFYSSAIEKIAIPSNLINLKDDWCSQIPTINKIEVSPQNPRYCCYEDKFILGKTSLDQSNYDCLVFCVRNIKNVVIPNCIEHICCSSFDSCKSLQLVKLNSNLKTIDNCAFLNSTIGIITIPSSVTFIGKNAFENCVKLEHVEFEFGSKLQKINDYTFSNSKIRKLMIPSSVEFIGEHALSYCSNCKGIYIPSDSKLQKIDAFAFYYSHIKSISIPSSVTCIEGSAFDCDEHLQIIEISNRKLISNYLGEFEKCKNSLLMIPAFET